MESVGNLKVPLTIPAARSIQAQCQRNIEFIAAVLSMPFSAWQRKEKAGNRERNAESVMLERKTALPILEVKGKISGEGEIQWRIGAATE